MRMITPSLHKQETHIESLLLDHEMIEKIGKEMFDCAGEGRPIDGWVAAGTPKNDKKNASSLPIEDLMEAWLGYGASRVSHRDLFWYYDFLKVTDHVGLMPHYFKDETCWSPHAHGLRVADLGTIMDVNLPTAFLPMDDLQKLYIAEVGGGYGRLAEVFFNVFPGQIRYLLVDSVPASLWFAYEYMRNAHPDIKVGFYFNGDEPDFEKFDCYVMPGWRMELVAGMKFDLTVNIQSMQEMDQRNVDFYIQWFDEALRNDGVAYLVNRRDHLFRGKWNYPQHWECVLKTPTPRSWLRDFPAEVYRKQNGNFSSQNALREAIYHMELRYSREQKLKMAQTLGYAAY